MTPSIGSPVVVDFPLRGEWFAPNTPGTRVPSHGTDMLGQRYAYDFVGIDPNNRSFRFYPVGTLRYLLLGVRLQDCFGWGQPIYAATSGTVVQAADGWPERNPVHVARDLFMMFKNARAFDPNKAASQSLDLRELTGNFVIVESPVGFVLYAHAQNGSIRVAPGDRVTAGQHLANVGHSGNSTAPHLHFHIMDRLDAWQAQGIPCCFRAYEVFTQGAWRPARNSIPKAVERLRG